MALAPGQRVAAATGRKLLGRSAPTLFRPIHDEPRDVRILPHRLEARLRLDPRLRRRRGDDVRLGRKLLRSKNRSGEIRPRSVGHGEVHPDEEPRAGIGSRRSSVGDPSCKFRDRCRKTFRGVILNLLQFSKTMFLVLSQVWKETSLAQ